MSSTITIPTSVTCMENVKIASLGQNHFFRSILNSHLLLQLIYFRLFYFCHFVFLFLYFCNFFQSVIYIYVTFYASNIN